MREFKTTSHAHRAPKGVGRRCHYQWRKEKNQGYPSRFCLPETIDTIVTFSFKDDNGCTVFLNRIEGKPLLLQELYDRDVEILSHLFQILTNSNEDSEFGNESRITILYTHCPYEASIPIPVGLPNPTKRKFPEFNRQFKNCK